MSGSGRRLGSKDAAWSNAYCGARCRLKHSRPYRRDREIDFLSEVLAPTVSTSALRGVLSPEGESRSRSISLLTRTANSGGDNRRATYGCRTATFDHKREQR